MKYWMIVKSGIERKRIRTIMTVLSIAVAFTLFSLGRSVAVAFNSEIDYAGKDRLIVSSRLSFTDGLPLAHKNRIEMVEGVDTVVWRQWFGGTYKERQNFFPKWPVPERATSITYPSASFSAKSFPSPCKIGITSGAILSEFASLNAPMTPASPRVPGVNFGTLQ